MYSSFHQNNGVSSDGNSRTCFVYGYVLTAIRTPE